MLQLNLPRAKTGEHRSALCRLAQQHALGQRVSKDRAGRRHDRLPDYCETPIGAVIVTTMFRGPLQRIGITARQRSIPEFDHHNSLRHATEYRVAALAECSDVTSGIHQSGLTARRPQCLNRPIDGVALRDASEIKMQPSVRPYALRLNQLEITHFPWSIIQARVKGTSRAFVELAAELQHFPSPGMYLQHRALRTRSKRRKIAAPTIRMHGALDSRDGVDGRIHRSLRDLSVVRLNFNRDESAERNAEPGRRSARCKHLSFGHCQSFEGTMMIHLSIIHGG
jgi:hypothetical protein